MKKLSIFLLSMLAATLFTACNDNDDSVSEQTFTSTINTRTLDGSEVFFSQGTAKAEVNYTDMTLQFSSDFRDVDGQTRNVTTPEMKMTPSSGSVYQFNSFGIGDEALTGFFDIATGVLWYTFSMEGHPVICTSHLLYAYSTTTVTNPDNGNHYSHKLSAYMFVLDAKGETCEMWINNFAPNINGGIEVGEIKYEGLNVTPTASGYTITANTAESSVKGFYTITNLNIVLDSQCRVIDGSFTCRDLDFDISGGLFGDDQIIDIDE